MKKLQVSKTVYPDGTENIYDMNLNEQYIDVLSTPNVKAAIDYWNIRNPTDRINMFTICEYVIPDQKKGTAYNYLKSFQNGDRLSSYRHFYGLRLCKITGFPVEKLYKTIED